MTTTPKPDLDRDVVIAEVHRVKEQLAARYGFDVRQIAAAAREAQAKSGRKAVSFAKKRD